MNMQEPVRDAFLTHSRATLGPDGKPRRGRSARPRSSRPTTLKVDPRVWATATRLLASSADPSPRRIRVVSATEVVVVNRAE